MATAVKNTKGETWTPLSLGSKSLPDKPWAYMSDVGSFDKKRYLCGVKTDYSASLFEQTETGVTDITPKSVDGQPWRSFAIAGHPNCKPTFALRNGVQAFLYQYDDAGWHDITPGKKWFDIRPLGRHDGSYFFRFAEDAQDILIGELVVGHIWLDITPEGHWHDVQFSTDSGIATFNMQDGDGYFHIYIQPDPELVDVEQIEFWEQYSTAHVGKFAGTERLDIGSETYVKDDSGIDSWEGSGDGVIDAIRQEIIENYGPDVWGRIDPSLFNEFEPATLLQVPFGELLEDHGTVNRQVLEERCPELVLGENRGIEDSGPEDRDVTVLELSEVPNQVKPVVLHGLYEISPELQEFSGVELLHNDFGPTHIMRDVNGKVYLFEQSGNELREFRLPSDAPWKNLAFVGAAVDSLYFRFQIGRTFWTLFELKNNEWTPLAPEGESRLRNFQYLGEHGGVPLFELRGEDRKFSLFKHEDDSLAPISINGDWLQLSCLGRGSNTFLQVRQPNGYSLHSYDGTTFNSVGPEGVCKKIKWIGGQGKRDYFEFHTGSGRHLYNAIDGVLTETASGLEWTQCKFLGLLSGTASMSLIDAYGANHLYQCTHPKPDSLVGRWTFATQSLEDDSGCWNPIELKGELLEYDSAIGRKVRAVPHPPELTDRGLKLHPGGLALARTGDDFDLGLDNGKCEKTLISWLYVDDMSDSRPRGSAITIDSLKIDHFDGIIFGEIGELLWSAGSNKWQRGNASPSAEHVRSLTEHPASEGKLIKMAISYIADDSGNATMTIFRNDEEKFSYAKGKLSGWTNADAEIIFGARHTDVEDHSIRDHMRATIVTAEIHNKALTAEEIKARPVAFLVPANHTTVTNLPVKAGDKLRITATSTGGMTNIAGLACKSGGAQLTENADIYTVVNEGELELSFTPSTRQEDCVVEIHFA